MTGSIAPIDVLISAFDARRRGIKWLDCHGNDISRDRALDKYASVLRRIEEAGMQVVRPEPEFEPTSGVDVRQVIAEALRDAPVPLGPCEIDTLANAVLAALPGLETT